MANSLVVGVIRALLSADTSEFSAKMAQATGDVKKIGEALERDFKPRQQAVNNLVREFLGGNEIRKANEYAQAVKDIGDINLLTEQKQRKVNQAVNDAIRVYQQMGEKVPKHLADLAVATTKIEAPTKAVSGATKILNDQWLRMTSAFGAGALIDRAIGGLTELGKAIVDDAGHLVDLSQKTGLSTKALQIYGQVAKETGASVDSVADAVFALGVNIEKGEDKTVSALKELGISYKQIKELRPEDQFALVAEKLHAVESVQERNRLGLELMGKTYSNVAAAVVEGLDSIEKKTVIVGDAQLKAIDAAADRWDRFWDNLIKRSEAAAGQLIMDVDKIGEAWQRAAKGQITAESAVWGLIVGGFKMSALGGGASGVAGSLASAGAVATGMQPESLRRDIALSSGAGRPGTGGGGGKAPSAAQALAKILGGSFNLSRLPGSTGLGDPYSLYGLGADSMDPETIEWAWRMLASRQQGSGAQSAWMQSMVTRGLPSSIAAGLPGATGLAAAPSEGLMSKIFGMSGGQFGQQMTTTLTGALMGGGNVGASLGSVAGQDLGKKIGSLVGGIGGAFLGPIGSMALSWVGGKLGGAISGLIKGGAGGKANDARDAAKQALGGDAAGLGLQNLVSSSQSTGASLGLGYNNEIANLYQQFLGAGKDKDVTRLAGELKAALDKQNTAIAEAQARLQKYGLTLDDLKSPQDKLAGSIKTLVGDFAALKATGFSVEQITKGASGGLNQLLKTALDTGGKLPASLKPYLEELIKTNGLTDDVKNKLLGLGNEAAVPWREMQAIAEEFGIDLQDLGSKFQQGQLTESAADLAAKFDLLVANGANVDAVINGMAEKANGFLQNAIKWGLEVPASMRPMLEAMQKAGKLTDENGEKLEDLEDVKFGKTLAEQMDPLLSKLDELIEVLKDGVPDAVNQMVDRVSGKKITIPVEFETSGGVWNPGGGGVDGEGQGFAGGSGGLRRFAPSGEWVQLHGTEEVLTAAQSHGVASMVMSAIGGSGRARTVILQVDKQVLGRVTLPAVTAETERLQIR